MRALRLKMIRACYYSGPTTHGARCGVQLRQREANWEFPCGFMPEHLRNPLPLILGRHKQSAGGMGRINDKGLG